MRKYFYILLVLVAIVSVYTVACKNKPTAMAEFTVLDDTITNSGTDNGEITNNIIKTNDTTTIITNEITKDDGLLTNYVGTYITDHIYHEGGVGQHKQFQFKAKIDSNGKYMEIYKGDTLFRRLYRDKTQDKNGKYALYDWELHYATFSTGVINLTFNRWTLPITLKKQ